MWPLPWQVAFTREVLASCPVLRHVAVFGIGVDNVDRDACRELGITVTHTPGYSAAVVAEMAIALALAAARRIPQVDREVRRGEWPQVMVGQLHGKTMGVVGTGPIGQRVAGLGVALGMETIAWTRNPTPERARDYGVTFVALEELLARADVISLQLPLTEDTRGLIGARELGPMKPNAILVNVGRGAVVVEEALVEVLASGRIAGASLDVFATEPLPAEHPLRRLDNVVLSPHIAADTPETNAAGIGMALENIGNWADGFPTNVVV